MIRSWYLSLTWATMIAACAPQGEETAASTEMADSGDAAAAANATVACVPSERMPLEDRPSPYDSTVFEVAGQEAKICYGRPSMRDRVIFGELVPYDTLWRTGANEPTTVHLPVASRIAGIGVGPGSYTIYTVPGVDEWTVIVNRSTSQWGIETQYTDEVRAQEVGRATVAAETLQEPVETFTITAEPAESGADLVLEWERTRVRVPVRPE